MHRLKHTALLLTKLSLITLFLWGCNGDGHSKNNADRGESRPPITETPPPQEFGDVVARLVQSQDDTSEPEEISPDTWSFNVNENEAAFDRLL